MCYLEVSERKPFQELFWDIWRSSGYALPTETHRSVTPSLPLSLAPTESETQTKCFAVNAANGCRCFTFVMATNRQRYVTSYPQDKLFLVSVTDLRTMREEDFVATAVRHISHWRPRLSGSAGTTLGLVTRH
jgi:hypothetical protein